MLLVWLNILHRFLSICQRVWPQTTRTRTASTSVQRGHCITICQGSLCLGAICAAVTLKSEINCSCTLAHSGTGLCEVNLAANFCPCSQIIGKYCRFLALLTCQSCFARFVSVQCNLNDSCFMHKK